MPRNAAAATPPPAPRLTGTPVLFVRRASLGAFRDDGHSVEVHLRLESFEAPSVNVIGVVRGTDPKLRDEYVLFSSHQDHDGVRYSVNGDSIWSGADDNASTSVALLAIARAFVKQPAKRSALFVFHGAEERGLLGSRYHAAHPVVPLASIVAVLNGDMIGRNNPDSAALLGSQPPHRNSSELVRMALDANGRPATSSSTRSGTVPRIPKAGISAAITFRTRASTCRPSSSRRISIPITTRRGTSREKIDYPKLTHMTKWMYVTGWIAANAATRPAIDPGFKLER